MALKEGVFNELLHYQFPFCSSNLTWRDVQYLIVYTSNPLLTDTTNSIYNGAGLLVSRQFGFGVIDAEAMVTRAQHWINVPQQQNETIIVLEIDPRYVIFLLGIMFKDKSHINRRV